MPHNIKTIAVVGPGLMGSNIVLDFASHGYHTWLIGHDAKIVEQGISLIAASIEALKCIKKLTQKQIGDIWQHIHSTANIEDIPHDISLVVETVFEDLELKQHILAQLEQLCANETILLSNTSSFTPSLLAANMKFPERFINAHYFNPSHIVPLVELTGNNKTNQEILERLYDFYTELGKKPVIVKKEITGFIANRLQFALLREACNLVDEGVANANDIDEAVRASFIPRVAVAGIFQVFDLTGWDLMAKVWQQIVPTLSNQTELPDCILEKLKSNELGVKTGNGFYNWDDTKVLETKTKIIQSLQNYKNN